MMCLRELRLTARAWRRREFRGCLPRTLCPASGSLPVFKWSTGPHNTSLAGSALDAECTAQILNTFPHFRNAHCKRSSWFEKIRLHTFAPISDLQHDVPGVAE